jgi:hypothetical protein
MATDRYTSHLDVELHGAWQLQADGFVVTDLPGYFLRLLNHTDIIFI